MTAAGNTPPLKGKRALISGGGRGIGAAITRALARAGAEVVVTWRERREEAQALAAELAASGAKISLHRLDIADPAAIAALAADCGAKGGVDILINNAGILQQKDFFTITAEEFDRIFAVNVRGTFLMAQAFMQQMRKNAQGGSVINIASVGGQLGGPLGVHYAASKAAVIGLTRSLARIGAPDIRVNCISPGIVETEMVAEELASPAGKAKIAQTLAGRAGYPEEIGECAAFLCSDGARYITGQTINVNGGLYLG